MSENLTFFLSTISSITISTIFLSKPGIFKSSLRFLPTLLFVSSLQFDDLDEGVAIREFLEADIELGLATVVTGFLYTTELGLELNVFCFRSAFVCSRRRLIESNLGEECS